MRTKNDNATEVSMLDRQRVICEKRREEERRSRIVALVLSVVLALVLIAALLSYGFVQASSKDFSSDVVSSDLLADTGSTSDFSRLGSSAFPIKKTTDGVRRVIDCSGRGVDVPLDPVSIAVFDSFSGEFAVMIGAGQRLCGVPAGVRSDVLLQRLCPRLNLDNSLSSMLSLSGNSVNIETVLQAKCDLAIVKDSMSDTECAKLDSAKIAYVKVGYSNMTEQMDAMRLIGQCCGAEAESKAEEIASYYADVVDQAEKLAQKIPNDERISVYHCINSELLTDSSGSLGADWIESVGCIDVSSEMSPTSGTDYQTTAEQIYAWAPDVIICNASSAASGFREDSRWSSLNAVRSNKVLNIPVGATRWGQRGSAETYLAILWLGCQVYPELYSDIDLKQTVSEYYSKYLALEISDEDWDAILSGDVMRSAGSGQGTGGSNGI